MAKLRLIVFFLPLALSLPFINRAFFVDDSYFVEIASWLKDHPAQPYHFRTDDAGLQNRGWEENGFVRMVNPLVHQYYLAALMKVGGSREWFLRLGGVLLSCFSALFIFEFARRWTRWPFLSTVLVLVTPVHWLTAHSLLIDSTLTFFFLGGLFFFLRAMEKDNVFLSVLSGIFMGLAILTKYPGLLILPLSGLWLILKWKKISRKWIFTIAWTIALMFLGAYSAFTAHLYGRPHILAASARMVHVFGWAKILMFFVFFSGSLLVPLLSWRLAGNREKLLSLLIVGMAAAILAGPWGGFSWLQGSLIGLWLVTSFLAVFLFLKYRADWIYPRDYFLFGWVAGFSAMMLMVMDWVAVRYYAIAATPMVFLTIRLAEIKWREGAHRWLTITCVFTFLMSSLLAYADFQQAEPSRQLVHRLKEAGLSGGERHFYLGDSFTMSYLRSEGWIPAFPETNFQKGDMILAKEVTMPLVWFARKPLKLIKVAEFDFPTRFPIKVMDYRGSAGFYASVWGALPFTFSRGPWERFHLFEVESIKPAE